MDPVYGIGLDVGTMNLVSARRTGKGLRTRKIRDCFLSLPIGVKKRLNLSGVAYVERPDHEDIIVTGDAALELATIFPDQVIRRPLKDGLISSDETDAIEVLGVLLRNVLGDPKCEDEACYFSVPAEPVDANRDIIYHTGVFEQIISRCGYEPYPFNEASAVIFSEASAEKFSAIGISAGAGMTNCALTINALSGLQFSIARGGDWIDAGVARSIEDITPSRACSIKEKGIDLMNPKGRVEDAISMYYKSLIDYTLKHISNQFKENCKMSLDRPIPIILAGGTSLAGGFVDLFSKVFEKKYRRRFPIEISEIRHARNPLETVSHGLLVQAIQEYVD